MRQRDYGAGAGLGEKGQLGGRVAVPGRFSGKTVRGEAAFSEGHGNAAIADVMRRGEDALRSERYERFDQARFGCKIDGGRNTTDDSSDRAGIFGRSEFSQGFALAGLRCGRSSVATTIEQNDGVAFVAEAHGQCGSRVFDDAEHADDGRGIDGFAERVVIEADVAAGDG